MKGRIEMKKHLAFILTVSMLTVSLAACNNQIKTDEKNIENSVVHSKKEDVTITIPKDYIGDEFQENLTDEQKDLGFKTATKNNDGSVTYTMTKEAHENILKEITPKLEESLNDIVNSGKFPSFKKIEHNSDFTEMTVKVDKNTYENSFDGFANYSIIMVAGMYQMLEGKSGEDIVITLNLVDDVTKSNFETLNYPEDFETDTTVSQEAVVSNYAVTIDSARIAKNYENKDCLVVDFSFTNNSDSNQSFASAMIATAFQNGVQIDSTVGIYEDSSDVTDTEYKMLQPGATAKVTKAYILVSQTPVDIEVSEFLGNGTVTKRTFDLN